MQTVAITGGTGFIGSRLSSFLIQKGYKVIIFSRQPAPAQMPPNISFALWNVATQQIDAEALASADYVVHLAGENVAAKRWTKKQRKKIVDSRAQSSALLIQGLQNTPNSVQAVISMSAIGWYGADAGKQQPFTEDAPPDSSFLGETCRLWEEAIQPVTHLQKRLVILRCGIVLGSHGGFLQAFQKPVQKWGIAPVFGSGRQIMSWIHIEDLCRMILFAIETPALQGVYNAVAPQPIMQQTFIMQLAKLLRGTKYMVISLPGWLVKLVLGAMSVEVLKSTTVSADKIKQTGFTFFYPSCEVALKQLLFSNTG